MRKSSLIAGCALVLLAARPAAAEFISYYDPPLSDGYGVTYSVGDPYCPDHYTNPYAVAAPVYVPVPVVVYSPPPPPVVVYSPPVIFRSLIVHRPIVEKRVIVRHVVRDPVVVKRHVVVREREVVSRRHVERPGRHDGGLPPGLKRIQHRR